MNVSSLLLLLKLSQAFQMRLQRSLYCQGMWKVLCVIIYRARITEKLLLSKRRVETQTIAKSEESVIKYYSILIYFLLHTRPVRLIESVPNGFCIILSICAVPAVLFIYQFNSRASRFSFRYTTYFFPDPAESYLKLLLNQYVLLFSLFNPSN